MNTLPGGTALVLTGGGARAAYQVGVLAAIADRTGGIGFPILTGDSSPLTPENRPWPLRR
jgi:NTE family protein